MINAGRSAAPGLVIVLAALVGAIVWNLITWCFGLPSSSSHALIGGLAGAALAGGAVVHWSTIVDKVLIPMVASPLVGFVLAFAVMLGDPVDLPAAQPAPGVPWLPDRADRSRPPRWRWATACRTRRRRWA